MSQNSLIIPNTGTLSGLDLVNKTNAAFDTLNTLNSGGSAPSSPEAFQLWADSANNVLWMRNEANTAWVPIWSTAHGVGGIPQASRDLASSVLTGASSTNTFAAGTVVVAASLGGLCVTLGNYSQTVNLSASGAGGMDAGSPPASGTVSIYAIYNPGSDTASIMACNYTVSNGPVYVGSNMPAGYTLSCLLSFWTTTSGGQFNPGAQKDRTVTISNSVFLGGGASGSPTLVSVPGVPAGARFIDGIMSAASTVSSYMALTLCPFNTTSIGVKQLIMNNVTSQVEVPYSNLQLAVANQVYWYSSSTAGAPTFTASATSYTF